MSFHDVKTSATGLADSRNSRTDSYLSRYSTHSGSVVRKNLNCAQWVDQFPEYYYKKCEAHFNEARNYLAQKRISYLVKDKAGNYAKHLTRNSKAVQEEFFSKLQLLIERKESDDERIAILAFLAELCAIEGDFGIMALQALQELTESLLNVNEIIPEVVSYVFMDSTGIWKDELKKSEKKRNLENGGVLVNMSDMYFKRTVPLLVKLFGDTRVGNDLVKRVVSVTKEVRSGKHMIEVPIFAAKLKNCFDAAYRNISSKLQGDEKRRGLNAVEIETNRKDYVSICKLISLMVEDHETPQKGKMANAMWAELEKKLTRMLEKQNFASSSVDQYLQHAAHLNMLSKIIRNQRNAKKHFEAADRMADRDLETLFETFRGISVDEGGGAAANEPKQRHIAALMNCISAVLCRSKNCYGKLKKVGLNMNINRFYQRYFKLASANGQHGTVVLAALETINIMILEPRLWHFRMALEEPLPGKLQTIMKNLIQKKLTNITKEDSEALVLCISMMQYYNEIFMQGEEHESFQAAKSTKVQGIRNDEIEKLISRGTSSTSVAQKLNNDDVKGYDREAVLFNVLESSGTSPLFTSDVVLAASKCLGSVPLAQFEQQEIRRVVTILSQMAAGGSDNAYKVITRILFLLARLAMAGSAEDVKEEVRRVSDGFKRLYASEVVATTLDLCTRASTEVTGQHDVKYLNQDKRNFMRACVKFLMIAWLHPDMREGMTSESAKTALSRVLSVESKLVEHSTPVQMGKWKPVFLEQTWAGSDIGNLLYVVTELGKKSISASYDNRDVVAFRVYHQLANVLQSSNMHDEAVLNTEGVEEKFINVLIESSNDKTGSFEVWNQTRNGTEIEVMKILEKEPLVDEDNQGTRQTIMPREYEGPGKPEEAMYNLIFTVMRNFLSPAKMTEFRDEQKNIIQKLETWRSDAETVVLIRTSPTEGKNGKPIEAIICGGKVLPRTERILGGKQAFPDPQHTGEMYCVYVHPDCHNNVKYLNELFSEFSHQMYLRKYSTCLALVHDEEIGMFSSSDGVKKGEKMPAAFSKENLAKKVREDRKNYPKKEGAKGPFWELDKQEDIVKPYLRMWDLYVNIWQENVAHNDFLEQDGILKLTQFATKSKTDESPNSPTRDLLKSQKFGTELMLLLNDRAGELKVPSQPLVDETFNDVLRHTFINPLVSNNGGASQEYTDALKMILTDRNDTGTPAWNKFLVYSDEENKLSIQSVTPFPEPYAVKYQSIFRPNPHSSENYLFHRGPCKQYEPQGALDCMESANVQSTVLEEATNLSEYVDQTDDHCEMMHKEAAEKKKEADLNAEKLKEKQPHLHAIVAALLRSFYVLITKSSTRVREKTQSLLRKSKIVLPIVRTMKEFDYGIDRSVFKREKHNYGAAMKFLVLTQELTDINARGHKACLEAIEFYELLSEMVLDIMDKMKRLIASRDFDVNNYDRKISRRLEAFDEKMLCESTATVVELVREIASLNFFEGKKPAILRGNHHCRKAAIVNMFTKKPKLVDTLVAFLQYDAEVGVTGVSLKEVEKKNPELNKYQEELKYRREYLDQMRINAVTILAELMYFDKDFKYRFFGDYCCGTVKAIVGLRQSFILDVMRTVGSARLRIELNSRMIKSGFFHGSREEAEVIEELAIVEYDGACRLLVLTGERYFLSKNTIPFELQVLTDAQMDRLTPSQWSYFTSLEAFSYEDVRGIYTSHGDQMFAIVSVHRPTMIFSHMVLGVVSRCVGVFARYCRDDLDEPLLDRPRELRFGAKEDEKEDVDFFDAAFESIHFVKSKRGGQVVCQTVAQYGFLNGSLSRRMLFWVRWPQNQDFLIECEYDLRHWRPGANSIDGFPNKFYSAGNILELKSVLGFEFSDSSDPSITLKCTEKGRIVQRQIKFACDAAREIWRREIRKYIIAEKQHWSSSGVQRKVENVSDWKIHKFI